MNSKAETYHEVRQALAKVLGLDLGTNTCEGVYENGAEGGCFWTKRPSDDLAKEIYIALAKGGFEPQGVLREDYLRWTSNFLTKDKKFYIVMIVETIDDEKPGITERWKYKKEGFHSYVELSTGIEGK